MSSNSLTSADPSDEDGARESGLVWSREDDPSDLPDLPSGEDVGPFLSPLPTTRIRARLIITLLISGETDTTDIFVAGVPGPTSSSGHEQTEGGTEKGRGLTTLGICPGRMRRPRGAAAGAGIRAGAGRRTGEPRDEVAVGSNSSSNMDARTACDDRDGCIFPERTEAAWLVRRRPPGQ